jgi:hypothetical protein
LKPIAKVKLGTQILRRTMEAANKCARWPGGEVWDSWSFGKYAIHKLTLAGARRSPGLAARVGIRPIAKVADAYRSTLAPHRLRTKEVRRHKKAAKLGNPLNAARAIEGSPACRPGERVQICDLASWAAVRIGSLKSHRLQATVVYR